MDVTSNSAVETGSDEASERLANGIMLEVEYCSTYASRVTSGHGKHGGLALQRLQRLTTLTKFYSLILRVQAAQGERPRGGSPRPFKPSLRHVDRRHCGCPPITRRRESSGCNVNKVVLGVGPRPSWNARRRSPHLHGGT